jgi:hypothetical protein
MLFQTEFTAEKCARTIPRRAKAGLAIGSASGPEGVNFRGIVAARKYSLSAAKMKPRGTPDASLGGATCRQAKHWGMLQSAERILSPAGRGEKIGARKTSSQDSSAAAEKRLTIFHHPPDIFPPGRCSDAETN